LLLQVILSYIYKTLRHVLFCVYLGSTPLFETTKSIIDGEEVDMINTWACGSIIWQQALSKNPRALGIAKELVGEDRSAILLLRCFRGDAAAQREAVGAIAFEMEDKMNAARGENSGESA
jgi:hypothetical protein